MKRFLGPLLLIILILGVGAGIFFSVRDQLISRQVVTVRGLIGSEKEPFFQDQRVKDALRRGGFIVQYEKAGSRQIATSFDLSKYDFAFPAGVPAAEKIRQERKASKSYDVFFTPMAIASWKPIAEILTANGIAQNKGTYYTLDMSAALKLMADGKRWSDLTSSSAYSVNKSVLIDSTDVRTSNSAAMYLALASYVANDNNIIQSDADIQKVMPLMESLFLKQGYVQNTSEGPFQDYLTMGMGKAPLVMIYEAQFLYQASPLGGGVSPDMVLIYPEPTIYSKHILVPLSTNGDRLGDFLMNDPEIQHLAVEHGFRNRDQAYFQEFVQKNHLTVPGSLVSVIDPPTYETLERMIQLIEQKY